MLLPSTDWSEKFDDEKHECHLNAEIGLCFLCCFLPQIISQKIVIMKNMNCKSNVETSISFLSSFLPLIGQKNWSEELVRKIGQKNWSEKLVRKIGQKNKSEK
jgi:hypothetical protein